MLPENDFHIDGIDTNEKNNTPQMDVHSTIPNERFWLERIAAGLSKDQRGGFGNQEGGPQRSAAGR
jgi:hypothetical protein